MTKPDSASPVIDFGRKRAIPVSAGTMSPLPNTANLSRYELENVSGYCEQYPANQTSPYYEFGSLNMTDEFFIELDDLELDYKEITHISIPKMRTNTSPVHSEAIGVWNKGCQEWDRTQNIVLRKHRQASEVQLTSHLEPTVKISSAGRLCTASLFLFSLCSLAIGILTGLHLIYPTLAILIVVASSIFWLMFRELGKGYVNGDYKSD